MNGNNRRFTVLLLCTAILLAVFFTVTADSREYSGIYGNTLRFHVLANSDSEEDQKLKLAVKDAVILRISEEMNQCKTKTEAEKFIVENKTEIEDVAKAVITAHGAEHTVNLTLTREYYPRRTYGDVTLPAGEYSSVRILLGEAEGQNWWCVLFPRLCLGAAGGASNEDCFIQAGFTPEQYKTVTESDEPRYQVKFKILEIIDSLARR